MSIKEEYVWVNVNSGTYRYYENIGYIIPRITNNKGNVKLDKESCFKVKVTDLPRRSDVKLTKICDMYDCNQEIPNQRYKDIILQRERTGGIDCCYKCKGEKLKQFNEVKTVPIEDSLAYKFPELVLEWNYYLNNKTPFDYYAFSHKEVWWVCTYHSNHIYSVPIHNRTNPKIESGCPFCAGKRTTIDNCLATSHPELINEWNWEKNEKLTPYDITRGHNGYAWWICKDKSCGHTWRTTVNNRATNGHGCPECARTNNSGEYNYRWRGGATSLNVYLRYCVSEWTVSALEKYENRCFVTGKTEDLAVHHSIPFNVIRDEMLMELNLPFMDTIGEYTPEQRKLLFISIKEKHKNIEGVPLHRKIHNLYHSIYGRDTNVTYDSLLEFKKQFTARMG